MVWEDKLKPGIYIGVHAVMSLQEQVSIVHSKLLSEKQGLGKWDNSPRAPRTPETLQSPIPQFLELSWTHDTKGTYNYYVITIYVMPGRVQKVVSVASMETRYLKSLCGIIRLNEVPCHALHV